MALIQCRECGKEISSKSTACPGCGAPIKRKNRFAIGCLTLIGIWLLIGLLAEIPKKKSSSSSTTPTPGYANLVAPSSSPTETPFYTSAPTPLFTPSPTPDPDLLQITQKTWEKGGFDSVALWHVTFYNRSDKPIGNIRYRTRYSAETGDQVDKGGVDALLGDYTIRKVIAPHKKRTIEINDGFLHREAARANFEVVSWEFVNPP